MLESKSSVLNPFDDSPNLLNHMETADEYLTLPHNKLHMIEKPVGKLYLLLG